MGCDIHPTVQWLEYPKNEWSPEDCWSSLSCDPMSWSRDYALFARLAGVRCDDCNGKCTHAIVSPRGYPAYFNYFDEDFHTPSWLTLDELKRAVKEDSCADVHATVAAMEEFERRGFKTRLVFAFDN